MKKITITAKDKAGVVLGTREVECPENADECAETFDDKQLTKYCVSAWIIDVQDELRRATRGKVEQDPMVRLFKQLSPEQQTALMAKVGK